MVDAALGQADGDGARLLGLVGGGGLDRGRAAEILGLEAGTTPIPSRRREHVHAALD